MNIFPGNNRLSEHYFQFSIQKNDHPTKSVLSFFVLKKKSCIIRFLDRKKKFTCNISEHDSTTSVF